MRVTLVGGPADGRTYKMNSMSYFDIMGPDGIVRYQIDKFVEGPDMFFIGTSDSESIMRRLLESYVKNSESERR